MRLFRNNQATDSTWSIVTTVYPPTIQRRCVAGNVQRIRLPKHRARLGGRIIPNKRIQTEYELGVIYQLGHGNLTSGRRSFTIEHQQPDWCRAIGWFTVAYHHLANQQWRLSFSSHHNATAICSTVRQKQANAAAQIGHMYERGGFGVEQNIDTALRWFIEAKIASDQNGVQWTWVTDTIDRLSLARIHRQLEEEARWGEVTPTTQGQEGEQWGTGTEYNNINRQRQDVLNQKMHIKEGEENDNGTTTITEPEYPCCLETWSTRTNSTSKDTTTTAAARVVVTMTRCGHCFCQSCVTKLCHMKAPFDQGWCAMCRQDIDLSEVRRVKVSLELPIGAS